MTGGWTCIDHLQRSRPYSLHPACLFLRRKKGGVKSSGGERGKTASKIAWTLSMRL
jgi:hypothetical protein